MPSSRRSDRKKNPSSQPTRRDVPQSTPTKHSKSKPTDDNGTEPSGLNLSTIIPISLQQLLLDVFKTALLSPSTIESSSDPSDTNTNATPLDTKSLIQTVKSHLYQRDFDSAFTDASEDLLRAYALRWSAARALGYAGLLKGVLLFMNGYDAENTLATENHRQKKRSTRVVCLGGGAGAEIVALAAAWRDLGLGCAVPGLESGVSGLSLSKKEHEGGAGQDCSPGLSITAVDIADWSTVVDRLSQTIASSDVPTPKTSKHQPPLVPADHTASFSVAFRRADLLGLSESELQDILLNTHTSTDISSSLLITLMFTLNELFSTSMPKTTALLLHITDTLPPGTVLLVLDSPGSYSSLKLGKSQDGAAKERKYPMKFLLDHTLLSVAKGKWERLFTQDSRWWRRDAARLRYEVGDGAGLEDMRFQVHLYRRVE